jgi:hypothetical protein
VDKWKTDVLDGDVALAAKNGQIYMPVIFPGFSWYNLKRDSPRNAIPRNRGEFLWRQAYNARMAGAKVLKIAMFDEVNEGTAMFKIASRRADAPDQGFWLTLDADGAERLVSAARGRDHAHVPWPERAIGADAAEMKFPSSSLERNTTAPAAAL